MWFTIDMSFKLVRSNFNFSHWLANHTLQNRWKRAGLNKSFTVLPCLDIFNFLCQNPGSNLLRRGLLGCRVWGCFLTIFHLTLHFRNQLGNVFICNLNIMKKICDIMGKLSQINRDGGTGGGAVHSPRFWQTLSQPGGADYAPHISAPLPRFSQTWRHPWCTI